jgi:hypothetical protein
MSLRAKLFSLPLSLSIASLATQRYNGEGTEVVAVAKEIERNWASPGVLRDTAPIILNKYI